VFRRELPALALHAGERSLQPRQIAVRNGDH
jgi:hypothetical protein